jgi:hypothetical protein
MHGSASQRASSGASAPVSSTAPSSAITDIACSTTFNPARPTFPLHPEREECADKASHQITKLVDSNWAAVAKADAWTEAIGSGSALQGGNVIESAAAGRAA